MNKKCSCGRWLFGKQEQKRGTCYWCNLTAQRKKEKEYQRQWQVEYRAKYNRPKCPAPRFCFECGVELPLHGRTNYCVECRKKQRSVNPGTPPKWKICAICGKMTHRVGQARFCVECAKRNKRGYDTEYHRKWRKEKSDV